MQATLHKIKSRRGEDIQVSSVDDFKLSNQQPIDAELILRDPQLSLYCLDFSEARAIFVKVPAGIDLYAAPFMYQEQRKSAQEVLSVPLDTLLKLAERVPSRFGKIAFLFSVGRCGSARIVRLLSALPGVRTVSEPDFLSQLVIAPPPQPMGSQLSSLIRACLSFCLPAVDSNQTQLVVKPRGYTMQLAPTLWQTFPAMRAAMLYRKAEDAVASYLRMLESRAGAWLPRGATALKLALTMQPKSEREVMHRAVPIFTQIPIQRWASIGLSGLVLANWASMLQTYGDMRARGLPIALSRYEDFVESPHRALTALLSALGIPDDTLDDVLPAALARDAQAGTRLANHDNAAVLSDKERAGLREILRIVPLTDVPDRHA